MTFTGHVIPEGKRQVSCLTHEATSVMYLTNRKPSAHKFDKAMMHSCPGLMFIVSQF